MGKIIGAERDLRAAWSVALPLDEQMSQAVVKISTFGAPARLPSIVR